MNQLLVSKREKPRLFTYLGVFTLGILVMLAINYLTPTTTPQGQVTLRQATEINEPLKFFELLTQIEVIELNDVQKETLAITVMEKLGVNSLKFAPDDSIAMSTNPLVNNLTEDTSQEIESVSALEKQLENNIVTPAKDPVVSVMQEIEHEPFQGSELIDENNLLRYKDDLALHLRRVLTLPGEGVFALCKRTLEPDAFNASIYGLENKSLEHACRDIVASEKRNEPMLRKVFEKKDWTRMYYGYIWVPVGHKSASEVAQLYISSYSGALTST